MFGFDFENKQIFKTESVGALYNRIGLQVQRVNLQEALNGSHELVVPFRTQIKWPFLYESFWQHSSPPVQFPAYDTLPSVVACPPYWDLQ